MNTQLIIPNKIKIGFNNRGDTYNGKLAYVIYYDSKNVLRKEKSWESWRDKKIEPIDYENVPTEGFVLNKKVGGVKASYSWNARIEKVRVYDPREFEFEISIPNLLYILQECNASKGKGLEGKFVYSWGGTELVLLPVESENYKSSTNFTKLQSQTIKAKELILGAVYITKKQQNLIYLGKFVKHGMNTIGEQSRWNKRDPLVETFHVFYDENTEYYNTNFIFMKDLKSIGTIQTETIVSNYAELVDTYNRSIYGSKIVKFFLEKRVESNKYSNFTIEIEPGCFYECRTNDHYDNKSISIYNKVFIDKKGDATSEITSLVAFKSLENKQKYQRENYYSRDTKYYDKFIEESDMCLMAQLESGKIYKVSDRLLVQTPKEKE